MARKLTSSAAAPDLADLVQQAVDDYERPLVQYAWRILGDLDLARDVVQDTFLKLCDKARTQQAEIAGHLGPWLYTVCRNRAFDVRRKEKRMTRTADDPGPTAVDPSADPTGPIEQTETQQQVLGALNLLPEKQQEVVRLKFQQGLTYRQIAQVTDQSVGYVGYLIHMGLASLRREIAAEA